MSQQINSETPLLTIVVPIAVERGPFPHLWQWLTQALEKNIEVILVLDEFSEKSPLDLIQTISRVATRNLKVCKGTFGAPGIARNSGLAHASGRWVYFWDVDDLPNLEVSIALIAEVENTNFDFAVGSFEWERDFSDLEPIKYQLTNSVSRNIRSIGMNPGIWRFAFRRNSIRFKFSDLRMAEDQLFILQNCNFDKGFLASSNIQYKYISGAELQQTKNRKNMSDLANSIKITSDLLPISTGANADISRIFLARQLISSLKYGKFKTKCKVLSHLIFLGLAKGPSLLVSILNECRKVMRRSNSPFVKGSILLPLTGGLGNQLFQLSAALSVARGRKILLETSIGAPRLNSVNLPEICSLSLPSQVQLLDRDKSNRLIRKASDWC